MEHAFHRLLKNPEFGGHESGHDLGRADNSFISQPESALADGIRRQNGVFRQPLSGVLKKPDFAGLCQAGPPQVGDNSGSGCARVELAFRPASEPLISVPESALADGTRAVYTSFQHPVPVVLIS